MTGEWFLEERSKRFEQKVLSSDVVKQTIMSSPTSEFHCLLCGKPRLVRPRTSFVKVCRRVGHRLPLCLITSYRHQIHREHVGRFRVGETRHPKTSPECHAQCYGWREKERVSGSVHKNIVVPSSSCLCSLWFGFKSGHWWMRITCTNLLSSVKKVHHWLKSSSLIVYLHREMSVNWLCSSGEEALKFRVDPSLVGIIKG